MHDALHPGVARGMEERSRVLDRLRVTRAAVRESHPIRVVERGDPFKVPGQGGHIREVERANVDRRGRISVLRMARQRAHPTVLLEQPPGNGSAGVTERTRYEIKPGVDL